MRIVIAILAAVTLTSAGIYKGTASIKVGKRKYKCITSISYTISPPKCGRSTAKCKPVPRKPVKFAVETNDATLSLTVAKKKVSKCMVVPFNLCSDKSCGDVCATSQGRLQVMRYCQPDGSCETNSTPKCPGIGSNSGSESGQNSGSGSGSNSGLGSGSSNNGCIYNNKIYPLGKKINIVEKCSILICNLGMLGPQWDIQVLGHSCCQYNGQLLEEGHQVTIYNGQNATCCEGGMVVPINGPGTSVGVTNITFSENGQLYTQANTYNSSNGVLTLNVPPHKDYTQSTIVLHPEMNQQVLSSNGTCLLSDLSKSINVYKMAEEMQENKSGTKYIEDYKIKIRKSLLRHKDRQHLNLESRNLCKNQVVRKTIDKGLSKEEFEGLLKRDDKGESSVVVIRNPVGDEQKCWIEDACTNPGPNACGYGFPNPAGGGFTAHQLSATVICVQCCLEKGPSRGCCKEKYSEYCRCTDIKNKIDLMDCILGNETHYRNYEDLSGKIVPQFMSFNAFNPEENARALKFHVPSHDSYEDITIIMHAAPDGYWHYHNLKNNMLMKLGDTCHILDLPSDVFPMDSAVNFLEQGLEYIKTEDQTIRTSFLRNIGFVDYNNLHPDIQKLCRGLKVVKSERVFLGVPINQQFQLNITSNNLSSPPVTCCSLETATTYDTGCIKWPNPAGGPDIAVHEIVSAGVSLSCCLDVAASNPGCNPAFPDCCECHCTCSEITNKFDFSECLGRPQIPLRKRMTQSGSLTAVERHSLLVAMKNMKADTSSHGFSVVSSYHGLYCPHQISVYQPRFLPWHRLYTVSYDTGLRRHNHAARFPYWDWTTPMTALPDLVKDPNILDTLDPASPSLIPNPFYHPLRFIPPTSPLWNGGIVAGQSLLDRVITALTEPDLPQFTAQVKIPHDQIHVWVGWFNVIGNPGSMLLTATASLDPIFYLNHNMVDLIWAVYQYLNPLVVPTASQQAILLNPFHIGTINPNQITLASNKIGKTLDYKNNLCYTYDLDIGSSNIVFGGMTLLEISNLANKIKQTDRYYVGFYLNSYYETSAIIKYNICYDGNCDYPGGEIPVFGGSNQIHYNDDIVSKIDVTYLMNKYGFSKNPEYFLKYVRFEVTEIIGINGEKLSTDMVYQPVSIIRPRDSLQETGIGDHYGVYFGQGQTIPPQMSISYGTRVSVITQQNSRIYKAKNEEAFKKCDIQQSTLALISIEETPKLEEGYHYYFGAQQICQSDTRMKLFVYSSRTKLS